MPGASMQARAIHALRSVSPIPTMPSSVCTSTTMSSWAELVRAPLLDVGAHLARKAESGQVHDAALVRLREYARRSRDADRGRGDDPLEVRIRLQQALRLLGRLGVVVVAVGDLDELHVL